MITTEALSVSYGSTRAVHDVSLEVPGGKITAIVGPSGCGKSSFLAALNRMTDLIAGARVEGRVLLEGRDVHASREPPVDLRRRVGMIFQRPNPFPMSIRRNVQLALKEHGTRRRQELEETTERVLRDVGLFEEVADRLDRSALELSGGQQQRLCIARALALEPDVLLMDEPCSALDPIASGVVEDLIVSLRGRFTMLVVTHDLPQARRIADHVAVFWVQEGAGRMIEHGPTAQVFEEPRDDQTRAYVTGLRS